MIKCHCIFFSLRQCKDFLCHYKKKAVNSIRSFLDLLIYISKICNIGESEYTYSVIYLILLHYAFSPFWRKKVFTEFSCEGDYSHSFPYYLRNCYFLYCRGFALVYIIIFYYYYYGNDWIWGYYTQNRSGKDLCDVLCFTRGPFVCFFVRTYLRIKI